MTVPIQVLGWPGGWVGLMEQQSTLRVRWIWPSSAFRTMREVGASP